MLRRVLARTGGLGEKASLSSREVLAGDLLPQQHRRRFHVLVVHGAQPTPPVSTRTAMCGVVLAKEEGTAASSREPAQKWRSVSITFWPSPTFCGVAVVAVGADGDVMVSAAATAAEAGVEDPMVEVVVVGVV